MPPALLFPILFYIQDIESDAMLDVLGRYRVSLITVSWDSPLSLAGAVAKWDANGLLDLVSGPYIRLRMPHTPVTGARIASPNDTFSLSCHTDGRQDHVAERPPRERN